MLMVLFLYSARPAYFQYLDYRLYDTLLGYSHPAAASPISIVAIDEKSLSLLGQWPWPRHRLAALIQKLQEGGAKAIALDIILAEPDRTSPVVFKTLLEKQLGRTITLSGISPTHWDNDGALAAVLARGPFILGYAFLFDNSKKSGDCAIFSHPVVVRRDQDIGPLQLSRAQGVVCNLDIFNRAAAAGFLNVRPDEDGIIRRAPLLIEHEGTIHQNLALRTFLHARGQKDPLLLSITREGVTLKINDLGVPLDEKGQLLLRYRGKGYTHIPAVDVLEEKVAPGTFQDKIVLVGATAAGLADLKAIPLNPVVPGVEIQATILDNLWHRDFLHRPLWAPGAELLLVGLTGILAVVTVILLSPLYSLPGLALLMIILWQGAVYVLRSHGLFLSPLFPMLVVASEVAFLTLLLYGLGKRKLRLKTQDILDTQELTINALAALAETRDSDTGGHIRRTQLYVQAISEELAKDKSFAKFLTPETIELLCLSAPLHDIGKVGIPDRILLKAGPLTGAEFEEMKRHTTYASEALIKAEERLWKRGTSNFLRLAKDIAKFHHEKWAGAGYPEGRDGRGIPLAARIMAVADVYDALVSSRVYKSARSHEEAVNLIVQGRGSQFDPNVVDAFLRVQERIRNIATEFADHKEASS